MKTKKATLALGVGLLAALLAACTAATEPEVTSSEQSALQAAAPTEEAVAPEIEADPNPLAPKPPAKCKVRAPDGRPPVECVNYCRKALADNEAYRCVEKVLGQLGGTGIPSKESMAACGCTYGGEANGVFPGGRPIFKCPGSPPFYVSPVPGYGTGGIGVMDPEKFPSCFFDIWAPAGPGTPIVVNQPSDTCMNSLCHNPAKPFIPWSSPMPVEVPAQQAE